LRALGVPVQAGRRAALTGLAAQLPAAVLADTLGLQPRTAVRWMHDAGADWNRYAADLARTRNHQPGEQLPASRSGLGYSARLEHCSLPVFDAGVPLRDVQEVASHADPR